MKFFILIFLSAFLVVNAQAQVLKGKVVDANTGDPLVGAVIGETSSGNGGAADFEGSFELQLQSLPSAIQVSYIGFETQYLEVNSVDLRINIKLVPNDQLLQDVNVVSDRILEKQKRNPLTVESMDAIAIKEVPTGNFYEGLAALKGVDIASASLGFRIINTRGFNSTSPVRVLQIIDGVDNQSPGLNFSLGNFLGAPDLDVKAVEVVQGASSAYYGPGAFNGVISMETKNPFLTPGLSVNLKVGERSMFQPSVRWADVFRNSNNHPWFAYKLNVLYLNAQDWEANNYTPIYGASDGTENPGRFDAVNIYGDEYFPANDYSTASPSSQQYRGAGTFYRTGYREEDLVDYNTENLKVSAAAHFRLKPELDYESPEIILQSNIGQGTTVYQGDNRFSLRNILFYQNRVELRKNNKYFLRAYATHEDAGDSYDPYFTAKRLQEDARSNEDWASVYMKYWQQKVIPRMNALGYPELQFNPDWPGALEDPYYLQFYLPYSNTQWMNTYQDSLAQWHRWVEDLTNNGNANIPMDTLGYYAPGTVQFNNAFNRITSSKNNDSERGTKFYDRSALYQVQGEYQWSFIKLDELRAGFSARLYTPDSDGTIFIDTLSEVITGDATSGFDTTYTKNKFTNHQYGFYVGAEKKFSDKWIASATLRADKNQNFDAVLSPAASLVYSPRPNHFLRVSFTSAVRNPTLTDQYLNLNVGPAILRGNLDGVDSLITIQSFSDWRDTQKASSLNYFNIDPIRPEQAQSIEVGYRATLGERVFLDVSAFTTFYKYFIGYRIGIDAPFDTNGQIQNLSQIRVYRYAANSTNDVTTQGANLGVNYYYWKQHAFSFNYSYNKLAKKVEDDPIIPAFNTPLHKFNVGLNGRELWPNKAGNTWGYAVNYKWVDQYFWEGSPQFTGPVPGFDVVDAQVNYTLKKSGLNFKVGCSNLLNNLHIEAYGGPLIGRLAFAAIQYEWAKK
jgi:outer membrane receptor protein involved in Fe transport